MTPGTGTGSGRVDYRPGDHKPKPKPTDDAIRKPEPIKKPEPPKEPEDKT